MAEDRFYFWRGFYDALATLPTDAQRGRFVMAICAYAFNDEETRLSDDPVLAFAWMVVRDQVRESVEIGRKQSERGSRGGRPRKKPPLLKSESGAETTAESVRYGNVPNGYAPSLTAPALAVESQEPNDPEANRRAAMDAIAELERIEAEESAAGDGG